MVRIYDQSLSAGNEIYHTNGRVTEGHILERPATTVISTFGMPFVGKGTQIDLLRAKFPQAEVVPIGETIRAALKDENHRFHSLFQPHLPEINRGGMVPNPEIFQALNMMLRDVHSSLILFDGFPRNISQAEAAQNFYSDLATERDTPVVVHNVWYDAPNEIVLRRGRGRWESSMTKVYEQGLLPEDIVRAIQEETVTSRDITSIFQEYNITGVRADDYPPTLSNRMETFYAPGSTADMLQELGAQGRLKRIDATGTPNEVHRETLMSIGWVPYAPEGQLILPSNEAHQLTLLPPGARR